MNAIVVWGEFFLGLAAAVWFMVILPATVPHVIAGFFAFLAAFNIIDRNVYFKRCNSLADVIREAGIAEDVEVDSHTSYKYTGDDDTS